MSNFKWYDVSKMLDDVDCSKYSHLLMCINRLNGSCYLKLVGFNEELNSAIYDVEKEGVYQIISTICICDLCKDTDSEIGDYNITLDVPCKKSTSEEALEYATMKHRGQYRTDGTEYITHPIRVANYVSDFKESKNIETLLASAYLHDTLEDTDATYYDLVGKFGSQIASIVLELTNDEDLKKLIGKTKYLEIKMKNMSSWALVIKLCDRLDNVSDLMDRDEKFRNKYVRETAEILDYLLNNRELSSTHLCIIKRIMDCLNRCVIDSKDVETTIESVGAKIKALA